MTTKTPRRNPFGILRGKKILIGVLVVIVLVILLGGGFFGWQYEVVWRYLLEGKPSLNPEEIESIVYTPGEELSYYGISEITLTRNTVSIKTGEEIRPPFKVEANKEYSCSIDKKTFEQITKEVAEMVNSARLNLTPRVTKLFYSATIILKDKTTITIRHSGLTHINEIPYNTSEGGSETLLKEGYDCLSEKKNQVTITTDKTEYEAEDTVKIAVKNNLDKSVWYKSYDPASCVPNLELLGYKDENWSPIPLLPSIPLNECDLEIKELKKDEVVTLEYKPLNWIHPDFLNFIKYKLSFEYRENKEEGEYKTIYSNEFRIKEKKSEKLEEIEEITEPLTIVGLLNDSRLEGAKEIEVLDKYAYVVGENGLVIIDISEPRNSTIVSSIDAPDLGLSTPGDVELSILDEYAYIIGPLVLTIVDISEPMSPEAINSFRDPKLGHLQDIKINNKDKYAYIININWRTPIARRSLVVIDVSNPKYPKIISDTLIIEREYPLNATQPQKIYLSEHYGYIVSSNDKGNNALIVMDISDPKNPRKISSFSNEKLAWANNIFISGKYAYVSAGNLAIIDISDPTAPSIVGLIKGGANVHVLGKYTFVTGEKNLTIIDISNPKAPEIVTSISDRRLKGAEDIYVSTRYVYLIASWVNNFVTIDLKGEVPFRFGSTPLLSAEIIEIKEDFVKENERETAFLQDGDIWVLSKDLKKKYKIIDTKETITDFTLSPDAKEIYWLNGEKELWKKSEKGLIAPLAGVPGQREYEKHREDLEEYKKYLEEHREYLGEGYKEIVSELEDIGKIASFKLSSDGEYIAYEPLARYTSCCAGIFNVPETSLWIMKNDGTEKIEIDSPCIIEKEKEIRCYPPVFKKWFPDSKKILISHYGEPDDTPFGRCFYEVGADGKNLKMYTTLDLACEYEPVLQSYIGGIMPFFSPDGSIIAYNPIPQGYGTPAEWVGFRNGVLTANIDGTGKRELLKADEISGSTANLVWSENSKLLMVQTPTKILVLTKEGEVIYEFNLSESDLYHFRFEEPFENIIFSTDNRYIAGAYSPSYEWSPFYKDWKEKIDTLFVYDILSKEIKEFDLRRVFKENLPADIDIYPQFFSKSGKLYYLVELRVPEPKNLEEKEKDGFFSLIIQETFPQLWIIDTNTWKNYKVAENVSQVVRVP